jgi:hypothetical protein
MKNAQREATGRRAKKMKPAAVKPEDLAADRAEESNLLYEGSLLPEWNREQAEWLRFSGEMVRALKERLNLDVSKVKETTPRLTDEEQAARNAQYRAAINKHIVELGFKDDGTESLYDFLARHYADVDASTTPGHTGEHEETMQDETAEFYAVAAQEDISPVRLRTIIDEEKAAKGEVAARETTGRATAQPRLDDATTVDNPEKILAAKLAVIEQEARKRVDGTLLELVHRYAEMRESIELPADGLKTLDQARSAALMSTTFGNLQARSQKYGLEPLPRDPRVVEARRQSSNFYRRERVKKPSGSALATASRA